MWAAIFKTWKSSLTFVPQGAKVYTKLYIEIVLTPTLLTAKNYFKKKSFTFQQDGALSHTYKKTQKWCQDHFHSFWSKKVWPFFHPTSTQWTFVFGPFWRQISVLFLKCHLSHSGALLERHAGKYHKKPCVNQEKDFAGD